MSAVTTHASPYSGQWYPGDAASLERLLDASIEESAERTGEVSLVDPIGFVVPHAGIAYSGSIAAAAYRHFLAKPPERIFLIGFPHRGCSPGVWIPDVAAFENPLGTTRVDAEAVANLAGGEAIRVTAEALLCDHSVEIQLPFLTRCAPRARLVPVYISGAEAGQRHAAARKLAETLRAGDVVIASSDFTHFGRSFGYLPFPVDSSTGDRLRDLDGKVIEAAASLDEEIFHAVLRETKATVCGREPIALLLETLAALEDGDEVFQERLDYRTSGEITGDFSHSVSYAALGYLRHSSLVLGPEEQALLLESARRTLERYQQTGSCEAIAPERTTPGLSRRAGVFVSLHKSGELRGCIGQVAAEDPIGQSVPDLTLSAATEDRRFSPVGGDEAGIEIEISVLSPMKRVSGPGKIHAGTHGVFVEAGGRRGLLLPQVAADRGWSTTQFLAALATKIGVRPDVFHAPETRLYRFRAQVFH